MKSLVERTPTATYENGFVSVSFDGGALLRFPVGGNRRLAGGTPEQLSNMLVTPFGIHWPDLDEDLSFEGLARGDYGQFVEAPSRHPAASAPHLSVAEAPAAFDAKPDSSG